jgi:hypothetical protein
MHLVIRGTVYLQERDDVGEIGRLRTLGELARPVSPGSHDSLCQTQGRGGCEC